MNKRLLVLVTALGVAVVILAAFYFATDKFTKNFSEKEPPITKTNIADNEIASSFPTDLPIEPGSKTVQNYEARAKDGRKQSTFSATTQKPLVQAAQVYRDFFAEKEWTEVEYSTENPDFVKAAFRKEADFLTIEAQKDQNSTKNIVDITLIESAE